MSDEENMKQFDHRLANRPLALVIFETGLLVIIALAAFVGNTCVLYVFYKTPRLRSVTSYYITTLAVSDVVVSITAMPTSIAISVCECDALGVQLGAIVQCINSVAIFGSLQTVLMIAINRYYCVLKPVKYQKYFEPKRTLLMIVGCWLGLASSIIPVTALSGVILSLDLYMYIPAVLDRPVLLIISGHIFQIFFVLLPMFVNILCYWKIYKNVKNHNDQVALTLNAGNNAAITSLSSSQVHVTRSMMALVIGFAVCWIPHSTLSLVLIHLPSRRSNIGQFVPLLANLSSMLNPVLYNIFNRPFRTRFRELILSPSPSTQRVVPVVSS